MPDWLLPKWFILFSNHSLWKSNQQSQKAGLTRIRTNPHKTSNTGRNNKKLEPTGGESPTTDNRKSTRIANVLKASFKAPVAVSSFNR